MANPQYNKMMKQVQEMQRKMAQAQEELAVETVEASAGGGIITVVVSRVSLEVKEVRIKPEAVDPDDVEMLQDLVVAATNEALRAAQDLASTSSAAPPAGSTSPTSRACSEAGGVCGTRLQHRASMGTAVSSSPGTPLAESAPRTG